MRLLRACFIASTVVFVAAACGSEEDDTGRKNEPGTGGTSNVDASGGSAGATSSGGSAGSSTTGGSAGSSTTGGASGTGGAAGSAGATGGAGGATGGTGGTDVDAPAPIVGTCRDPRPPGAAAPPPPPAFSGGTCPTLKPGSNIIHTSNVDRTFLLVVPSDYDGTEQLPLVFLWHWLGGDANGFLTKGEVQLATDQLRFAAVIPEAKDDALNVFKWPYSIIATPQQVTDEVRFFDDMFACVTQQYSIQLDCVASAGVSAGALWTDQLAGQRGQYLSSIMSLSGGVGGQVIKPWVEPQHKMPAFVLWGGPTDQCVTVQFQTVSKNLETELINHGHFFVECVHNCAHAEPPFEPPGEMSKYTALWQFFLDHPYWLAPGTSPWVQNGLPLGTPEWCGIGANSATIRTGACPPPACPI